MGKQRLVAVTAARMERWLIALVLMSSARSAATQTPVQRDSAGIRITENPARATSRIVFRLGAQRADIGGAASDPNDELAARGNGLIGVRLSDGTIAVPDVVRVQYFNQRGARIGMFGRLGAGPQEFRSLAAAEFCSTRGDTIVAGDLRNGRFAVIHGRNVVRTTPYLRVTGGGMAGCFDDGTLVMQGGLPNYHEPTYIVRLSRLKLDGTLIDTFPDLALRTPSAVTRLMHPSIEVRGQEVYVGDGATSEIRVYRADGRLTRIIRSADAAQRVTAADVENALRRQPRAAQKWWRPDTYPTFRALRVDPAGRLWVQEYSPYAKPTDPDSWAAFDANGRLIGRLEVPRMIGNGPAHVVSFGVDDVQVRRTDDDGFAHLTFYPIVRIQPGTSP